MFLIHYCLTGVCREWVTYCTLVLYELLHHSSMTNSFCLSILFFVCLSVCLSDRYRKWESLGFCHQFLICPCISVNYVPLYFMKISMINSYLPVFMIDIAESQWQILEASVGGAKRSCSLHMQGKERSGYSKFIWVGGGGHLTFLLSNLIKV